MAASLTSAPSTWRRGKQAKSTIAAGANDERPRDIRRRPGAFGIPHHLTAAKPKAKMNGGISVKVRRTEVTSASSLGIIFMSREGVPEKRRRLPREFARSLDAALLQRPLD